MSSQPGRKTGRGKGRPRLYTILPDSPFLETLAEAILKGDLPIAGGKPPELMDLPRWTVFLPTRRAVRALSEAFLRVSGDRALLLPRIRPLGDVDEDEIALVARADVSNDPALSLSLPPAIGDLERRLALTRLILEWSRLVEAAGGGEQDYAARATPAQASTLAAELAALLDTFDAEQVDLATLNTLAPERFADHWQKTLDFLKIVTEHWPRHLEEQGLMAPYARRDALMAVETERLLADPPSAPVIAAGSTATVPATAALLEAVAGLPEGAVVLPGLDLELDEESWQAIAGPRPHPEHPQFGMRQFLARVDATRDDVIKLDPGSMGGRTQLVSQSMRPALTTDKWLDYAGSVDREAMRAALEGVARIDAPTEQEEAEVISLLLRHAVEEPGCVAALVTPDRTLARRVSVRLEKWGLDVDDSAGKPLEKTLAGSFMDALGEAAAAKFAPVPLLALLKHPLTRLGRSAAEMRRTARLLEIIAFRQPATGRGLRAHREAVERMRGLNDTAHYRHPAIAGLKDADWKAVGQLLADLETALAPMSDIFDGPGKPRSLEDFSRAHVDVGEALALDEKASSASLWRGDAGEALADFFATLLTAETAGIEIPPADYLELYRSFVAGVPVRPRAAAHPRIHIWGPLEARLQRPDMVVLGGLNEGVWPATVETDPWLSRPMRAAMGLPAAERRIGLAAHDVAQLLGVARVYLTRSEKVGGTPTVPSRWLLRLDAVLDMLDLKGLLSPHMPWLAWARARDAVDGAEPACPPAPCPPAAARPTRLSVTRIEAWIANPYAIFARDILKLTRLDTLAGEPDAALKGTIVHDVLQRFAQTYPDRLPDEIAAELMRNAHSLFRQFGDHARVEAFWRGQLAVFARWFAATEPARRKGVARVYAEVRGALDVDGAFTLSARADRIDVREDGTLALYDYKTGAPPTAKQVESGMAPQLALEAAIAQGGGFEDVTGAAVSRLAYVRARGYGEGGEERDACKNNAPSVLAGEALQHLEELVVAYANESQPYTAMRRAEFRNSAQYRYDEYAHLARVKEWQAGGGVED